MYTLTHQQMAKKKKNYVFRLCVSSTLHRNRGLRKHSTLYTAPCLCLGKRQENLLIVFNCERHQLFDVCRHALWIFQQPNATVLSLTLLLFEWGHQLKKQPIPSHTVWIYVWESTLRASTKSFMGTFLPWLRFHLFVHSGIVLTAYNHAPHPGNIWHNRSASTASCISCCTWNPNIKECVVLHQQIQTS